MSDDSYQMEVAGIGTKKVSRSRMPSWVNALLGNPLADAAIVILIIIAICGVFAPAIAPHGYNDLIGNRLESPNKSFPLGTDTLGRDELSRIIYGARAAAVVGFGSVAIGTAIALLIGAISGYAGGITDLVIQRVVDAWMAFPSLVLLLTIISAFGTSEKNVVLTLGVLLGIVSSRIVRGDVMKAASDQYVLAARTVGASGSRIVLWHVLPNIMPTVIVLMSVNVGFAILAEASLSFLGFGIQPPTPTWGNMLSTDTQYMVISPWLAVFPGLAITAAVFAFNILGDALRDILDPRLRRA